MQPRLRHSAASLLSLLLLHLHASAQTITWDGSCGNAFWHSQCGPNTNWNPDLLPTLTHNVSIPQNAPTVAIPGSIADCLSISCNSGLSLTSNGILRIAGGQSSITNLALTLGSIELQTPAAILAIAGTSTVSSGKIAGSGELINTSIITGGNIELLNSAKLTNQQQMTLFRIISTANNLITNQPNATLTLINGTTSPGITGNGTFNNLGTCIIQHNGPTSTFTVETLINTAGPLIVQGVSSPTGTRLLRGGTIAGPITLSDNAHLHFASTGTAPYVYNFAGGSIAGNGNVYFESPQGPAGSDLQINGPVDVNLTGTPGLILPGATYLTLNDRLINHAKALWSGTTIRTGTCSDCPDAAFENRGTQFILNTGSASNAVTLAAKFVNSAGATVSHTLGHLIIPPSGSFQNAGQYNLYRGDIRQTSQLTGTFSVAPGGILQKPFGPDTGNSTISADIELHSLGSIDVGAHMLTFSNSALEMQTNSSITISDGSVVRFINGTHRVIHNSGASGGRSGMRGEDDHAVINGLGTCVLESETGAGELCVEKNATLRFDLGTVFGGGLYLGITGRMGGSGIIEMSRENVFYWAGGVIGVTPCDGLGGVADANVFSKGFTLITVGAMVGPASLFANEPGGYVLHELGVIGMTGSGPAIANQGVWRFPQGSNNVRGVQGMSGTPALINDTTGVLQVAAGNVSTHFVRLINRGKVHVESTGKLTALNVVSLQNGELTEGTWIVDPGGVLDLGGQLVTRIGPSASLTGSGSSCPGVVPQTNQGVLRTNGTWLLPTEFVNQGDFDAEAGVFSAEEFLNNDESFPATATVGPDAAVEIAGGIANTGPGAILDSTGGTVSAGGDIENGATSGQSVLSFCDHHNVVPFAGGLSKGGFSCATFNNNRRGMIRPGGPGAAGGFHITGHLNLFPAGGGGYVQIELGGTAPVTGFDQINVQGNATLGGTLQVKTLPPFAPSAGQQFVILNATGAISGQFEQINAAGQYSVSIQGQTVVLTCITPPVAGDITGDGVVNVNDLLAVLNSWGICPAPPQLCPADISPQPNGDGVVNVNDLLMVINQWS